MEGQTISHYRVLERLGAGGMGVVYKAEDLRLKRLVALKFLPPDRTRDDEAKERFRREAQAASALDHANICTVHEIDETADGQLFLAMTCYDGESLRQRIQRGPLAVAEALDIAIQVSRGLARAHEAGIVHRDIKPANIMITSRGEAKIVDFGLAKLADQTGLTQTGTTLGTVAYLSPEQTRGAEGDACSDVWAAGVTLYEMLTGRLPFTGDLPLLVLNAIQHQQPAPVEALRPDVPRALQRIVARALEKRREARYPSARELSQELLACRDALTAPVRGGSWSQVLRRPSVIAALAVVLLGVAVSVGAALRSRAEARRILGATQQLAEAERLAGAGELAAAFAMAGEIERVIPGDPRLTPLWQRVSDTLPIRSDPPGARVYRQPLDAPPDDWEFLGTAPLEGVRFLRDAGYRVRLEADGYRPVELMQFAIQGLPLGNLPGLNPVTLDPPAVLPENMVRVPGFSAGGVPFGSYLFDRHEVTNQDFKRFVDAGGYRTRDYWTHPFVRDGVEISWEDAVAGFRDQTGRPGPSTWRLGTFPEGQENHPVGGVSWYEAAAFARFAGKELPTTAHWNGTQRLYRFDSWMIAPRSNVDSDGPRAVGAGRAMNAYGIYDLVGNVREWCYNESGGGRATRGAAWTDDAIHAVWTIPRAPFDRDATNGFRLMRAFDPEETLARLRAPVEPTRVRDYRLEKPVPEGEYAIFKRLYAYSPAPLDASVEARDAFPHWVRERVAFDLPYGERGGAYLFLPRTGSPPFQTVIFWGGSNVAAIKSIDDQSLSDFDFLIRAGRAVAIPVFKGSLHRDPNDSIGMPVTVGGGISPLGYRDVLIQWVKDVSRTIDYIETRDDLDAAKVAFFGFSWGGLTGPIVLAVESRLKAGVLNVGGFWNARYLPEADPPNFAPRVRVPVLMVNGEHDIIYPLETSQKPLFSLLGTPPAHKRHYLAQASHLVPPNELIRETLDWLDRYLGPVR